MDSDLTQRISDRADELFDEILPESIDWRRVVCDYPRSALVIAAAGGFWIGRKYGGAVLSGLLAYGSAEASRIVGDTLGSVLGSNPFDGDPLDRDPRDSLDRDSFDETDFAGA